MKTISAAAKRALDVLFSAIAIVLTSPVWLVAAVAIKLEDRGPVFYKQKRWGLDGAAFELSKFRTMRVGADRDGTKPATENDPRVTRIGRILRAYGLDELPQFLTILRGDMSIVGPRALATDELWVRDDGTSAPYDEVEGFSERFSVKPGLTGMATIYVPKDSPPSVKLDYDLRYIRERSLRLDIKLIALSIWISFRGRWESREAKL